MIIKLKSGREIFANHGIIGITPEEDRKYLTLTEGYDGNIFTNDYIPDADNYVEWPTEDVIEICDIMIVRWSKYRDDLLSKK